MVEWLLKSPTNVSCSYASSLVYEEGTHNLVLTVSTSYNGRPQEEGENENIVLHKVTRNIQTLMLDNIEKTEKQNPDHLKESMSILSKYQAQTDRSFLRNSNISGNTFVYSP